MGVKEHGESITNIARNTTRCARMLSVDERTYVDGSSSTSCSTSGFGGVLGFINKIIKSRAGVMQNNACYFAFVI
jgi:hypothetical protein